MMDDRKGWRDSFLQPFSFLPAIKIGTGAEVSPQNIQSDFLEVGAYNGAWQGGLFFRSVGPSLALLTTKQHPLPIPYRIQCSIRTAIPIAFAGMSQQWLVILSVPILLFAP